MMKKLDIIYEDKELLVINKPTKTLTIATEKNKEKQEEIIEEERRETRKKIVILWLKITFALIFGFFSFYFYTEYISTKQIITKEQRIKNKKIPDSFNGIKIIQFSDLYYGSTIGEKEIDNLILNMSEVVAKGINMSM